MYRQCSCLYRYSAYIFNIGAYSDPYSSIGATLGIIKSRALVSIRKKQNAIEHIEIGWYHSNN